MGRPSKAEAEIMPLLMEYLGRPGKVTSSGAWLFFQGKTDYSNSTITLHFRNAIAEMIKQGRAQELHFGLYKIL